MPPITVTAIGGIDHRSLVHRAHRRHQDLNDLASPVNAAPQRAAYREVGHEDGESIVHFRATPVREIHYARREDRKEAEQIDTNCDCDDLGIDGAIPSRRGKDERDGGSWTGICLEFLMNELGSERELRAQLIDRLLVYPLERTHDAWVAPSDEVQDRRAVEP